MLKSKGGSLSSQSRTKKNKKIKERVLSLVSIISNSF